MQRPREGEIREHVNAVAFHPTKPFIAFGCNTVVFRATSSTSSSSVGGDGARPTSTIKIWSIVDQKFSQQWSLVGSIQAMAYSPDDGKLLAVATHTDSAFNSDHESIDRITLFNSQDGYRFVKHDDNDSNDSHHHGSSRVVSIAFCPPPEHPRLMNTVWKPLADATQHMAAQLVTPRADGVLSPAAAAAAQVVAGVASPPMVLTRQDSSMPAPPPGLTINPSMSNESGGESKYSSQPVDIPDTPQPYGMAADEAARIAAKAQAIRNGIENDRREVSLIASLDYRGQIRVWNFRNDRQWTVSRDTAATGGTEQDEPEFNGKLMFTNDGLALFVLGMFRLTGYSIDHKPEAVEIKDERKKKFEDARARRKKKAMKKKMEEEKAKKAKAEKAGKVVKSEFNRAKSNVTKYEKCTKFLDLHVTLRAEALALKKMYTFTCSTNTRLSDDDIAALVAANPAAAQALISTPIPGTTRGGGKLGALGRDLDEKKPTQADGGLPDETLEGFEPVAVPATPGVRFDVPLGADDDDQFMDSSDDELPVVAAFKVRPKTGERKGRRGSLSRPGSMPSTTTPMVVETLSADQWMDQPTRNPTGSIGSADDGTSGHGYGGGSISMAPTSRSRAGSVASARGVELKQRVYGLQRAMGQTIDTAIHIKQSGLNTDMQEYRILLAGQQLDRPPRREAENQTALRYLRVRVNHYRIHRKNPDDAKRPEFFDIARAGWCDWSLLCSEDRQWGVIQQMDMPPTGGYTLTVMRVDPSWGAQATMVSDPGRIIYRIVNWSLTDTNMISTVVGQHDYPVHDVKICPMATRDVLQTKGVVDEGESIVASASEDESVRLWSFTLQPAGEEDDPGDPVAKFVVERPRIDIRTGMAIKDSTLNLIKHERLFHTPATAHSAGQRISRPVTITSAVAPPNNVPQFLALLTPGTSGTAASGSAHSSSTSTALTSSSSSTATTANAPAKFTGDTTKTAATRTAAKKENTAAAMAVLPIDHDQTPLDGFEGTAKSSHKSTARDSCRRSCWWMN